MSTNNAEFDTPWKDILSAYFQEFMALCWPQYYNTVAWERGYKVLDTTLSKITIKAPIGNKIVDKLISIHLISGAPAYILVHIEVQGKADPHFAERMLVYRYRLRDLHNVPIASLAILIDKSTKWRPTHFKEQFWNSSLEMHFPIIKLLDYRNRIPELEKSNNPFAMVILAQLAATNSKKGEARLVSKISLIRHLYKRAWKKDDIINLLRFIDWVIKLPEELESQYNATVEAIEEELHVNYITTFERLATKKALQQGLEQGLEQGVKQGLQQGEGTMLLMQLEHKFTTVPECYRHLIEQADTASLLQWGARVLACNSLQDVFEQ